MWNWLQFLVASSCQFYGSLGKVLMFSLKMLCCGGVLMTLGWSRAFSVGIQISTWLIILDWGDMHYTAQSSLRTPSSAGRVFWISDVNHNIIDCCATVLDFHTTITIPGTKSGFHNIKVNGITNFVLDYYWNPYIATTLAVGDGSGSASWTGLWAWLYPILRSQRSGPL